jgi:hypothetical protein
MTITFPLYLVLYRFKFAMMLSFVPRDLLKLLLYYIYSEYHQPPHSPYTQTLDWLTLDNLVEQIRVLLDLTHLM